MTREGEDERPPTVLDARAAAAYLAVHIETLYRLARAGALPHTRVGRALRFHLIDLERYLEEQTSTYWQQVDERGRHAMRSEAQGAAEG
jgi:excisionase family DNA binding protein